MSVVKDGFVSLIRGQDEGRDSDLLESTQYVRGVNVSSRGGKVHTRKPFKKIDISDSVFTDGKFQGASVYRLDSADRLVASIGGKVININTSDYSVTDYSSVGLMDATVDQVHFVQAEQFFVAQDGINDGMIINPDGNDPDVARLRVEANKELPLGTIMAYGHGRLFVLLTELPAGTPVGERFFAAGDIMLPTSPETVFGFVETDYLAGGGALSMPQELGLIRGMNFLRNVQSSTGLGSLIVFGQYGASAFAINAPRIQWPEIDLSQVLFNERAAGTESPYSIIPVNNDIVYRSKDGVRTLGYTLTKTAGEGASLASEPFSSEIDPFMAMDEKDELGRVSMANVNDKLYVCFNSEMQDGVRIYKGLAIVDFDLVTTLGTSTAPAWDGAYTGLNVTQVLNARRDGKEVLYVFAKNETTGKNELYYRDDEEDAYGDGGTEQTLCRLYTKAYQFPTQFVSLREDLVQLSYADLYITEVLGKVDIQLYYRPVGHSLWIAFPTPTTIEATAGSLKQYRHRIRFQIDSDTFSSVTKHSYRNAIDFEFCIQWEGHMKLKMAIFGADEKASQPKMGILAGKQDSTPHDLQAGTDGVELDDFTYSIT